MTRTTTARIGVAALSLAAALALASCDDFFGNEDLKELIKADVAAATAPSVSVTMAAADKTSMGTPSPIGAQSYKVGIANPITTTVGDDYTFLSWTCTGTPDVDYRFEDAASSATTVTILNANPETALSIKPTFDRRPYVTIWDPYSGATDYTNKTITITFNEDIDPDSLTLAENGSVQITERSYTDLTDPAEHIESQLDMDIDGSVVTITPRSAGDAYSTYNYISITLSTDIADVAGNTMANEFAWFWKRTTARIPRLPRSMNLL